MHRFSEQFFGRFDPEGQQPSIHNLYQGLQKENVGISGVKVGE